MNDQFRNFFAALKETDVGTKVVIALSSVAMVAAIAVVGMVSNDAHYVAVWPDLTDSETAAVAQALAKSNVDFHVQMADGKSVIFVASDQRVEATRAAYEEGAIQGLEKGIFSAGSNSSSVFDGSDERKVKLNALIWSHLELVLESFDFVVEAKVLASLHLGGSMRSNAPTSCSVTIRTKSGRPLTKTQGQRVAKIVINSLQIDPSQLSIADTNGDYVYAPQNDESAMGLMAAEFQHEQDRILTQDINEALASLWGPNKVVVMTNTLYDFTQQTTNKLQYLEGVKNSESSSETTTPIIGSTTGVGGIPGTGSNVPNSTDDWASGDADDLNLSGVIPSSTTIDTESTSIVGHENMVTVSSQPTIKQRSISVSIDESLLAKQLDIDKQVQRMAAYDQARGDSYDSTTLPFFVPEIPEVVESDAVPTGGGLSTDFLIDKGVEIVSAIAFLFLLLKGLKSAKGGRPAAAQVAAGQVAGTLLTPLSPDGVPLPPIEIAPEQLARAQVEDMVKNNPERVAQILSNWVIEDRNTVNS